MDSTAQSAPAPTAPAATSAGKVVAKAPAFPPPGLLGRMPILSVTPSVDDGRWPAKCVVGEGVPVTAVVFREGHDLVACQAVLIDPEGKEFQRVRMDPWGVGTDRWTGSVVPDREGDWTFRVEAWDDPYGTWDHDATIKVAADVDTELMLNEGANLIEVAAKEMDRNDEDRYLLWEAVNALRDAGRSPASRIAAGTAPHVQQILRDWPIRRRVTHSKEFPLRVQRVKALYSSWYEIFPRSWGAVQNDDGTWQSGTLRTAADTALERIKNMGFDVVYLTPIHPIGHTNRKGKNNTLTTEPGDPGSPYAIGAEEGGHDAIHPQLGTMEDFEYFVAKAADQGLEVALDIALQCSPDHPWAKEHPEWFTVRSDGTIAYAENPPKKYQDIYPLNFDHDPEGIYKAVRDVLLLWASKGVKHFRVDNPHTKPVEFWEWVIAEVNRDYPDVVFLAEAFTKPAMMRTLAKVGFHQSYTYFTWRTTKKELTDYLVELTNSEFVINDDGKPGTADYMRPSFWPTTHDILTPQMWWGGPAIFAIRAVLAATMSPTWGIYSGYELVENVARPGAEEQIDNEKYEFKDRDFTGAMAEGLSLEPLLRRLNEIRREHPALQRLRGLTFHAVDNDQIIAFSRRVPASESPTGQEDTVLVICSLDPHGMPAGTIHLDMAALGMTDDDGFIASDQLTRQDFVWGRDNYVAFNPANPAHIIHVRRY